jgi:group I intron endonuclease
LPQNLRHFLQNNIISSRGLHTGKNPVIPVKIYLDAEQQKKQIMLDNKDQAGIYRWINKETGESYEGSAVNLSKRFGTYYSQYRIKEVLSRSKSHILSAIQKHGHSNFRLEILEHCDPIDLIMREQFYIDSIKPEYNILRIAGSSMGVLPSEETKMKISKALKGRSHLEVTKQKMRESRIGKKHSEKTKKILSELNKGKTGSFKGQKHSEETKQKMSVSIGSKIEVLNVGTNETTEYSSNYKAAEALGCSESTIRYYIKNKKLYKGKYFFKKDL